ncbi:MAG: hypothetical protein LBU88_06290 [Treponema sp.]|jgi:hypothetical protein|nr:hypothetical protein [Treponema sp.]
MKSTKKKIKIAGMLLVSFLAVFALILSACPPGGGGGGGGGGNLNFAGILSISASNNPIIVGGTLTANYDGSEEDFDYQWTLNGTDIPDADETTFVTVLAGEYRVKISKSGYNTKTSDAVTVIWPALPGILGIDGDPVTYNLSEDGADDPGEVELSARYNGSEDEDDFTYQWYRDGAAIAGADEKTYTTSTRGIYEVGAWIVGKYSETKSYPIEVWDSELDFFAGEMEVTADKGALANFTELTATYTADNDDPTTGVTYQWYRDSTPIPGATGTFTITEGAGSIKYSPSLTGLYIVALKHADLNTTEFYGAGSFFSIIDPFVAVSGLSYEAEVFTGDDIMLNTVAVSNIQASFKTIVWSEFDAGSTGASLDNVGTPTKIENIANPGTISIRATITDGNGKNADFSQLVTFTVAEAESE